MHRERVGMVLGWIVGLTLCGYLLLALLMPYGLGVLDVFSFLASVLLVSIAPCAALIGLLGLVCAGWARMRRRARGLRGRWWESVALGMCAIGTVTMVGMSGSVAAVADRQGGSVSIARALFPRSMSNERTAPDARAHYPAQGRLPGGDVDIYGVSRSDERGKRPVIVDIHGGGWNQDARMPATLRWFADHGYLVLRPSYELAAPGRPTADTVPDQVFSAYAWCTEHAAEWGGDPQSVSVFGDSAGGGLAVSTAYRAATDVRVPGPQAVVALYPTVDVGAVARVRPLGAGNAAREYIGADESTDPAAFERVSSARWIHAQAPRTLIIQGTQDTFVPPESVRAFAGQARSAGIDVTLVDVPWADHAFDAQFADSLGFQLVTSVTDAFLREA